MDEPNPQLPNRPIPEAQWPTPAIKGPRTDGRVGEPTRRRDRGARVEQNREAVIDVAAGATRRASRNKPSRSPAKVSVSAGPPRIRLPHASSQSANEPRCAGRRTAVMTRATPKAVVIRGENSLPLRQEVEREERQIVAGIDAGSGRPVDAPVHRSFEPYASECRGLVIAVVRGGRSDSVVALHPNSGTESGHEGAAAYLRSLDEHADN